MEQEIDSQMLAAVDRLVVEFGTHSVVEGLLAYVMDQDRSLSEAQAKAVLKQCITDV